MHKQFSTKSGKLLFELPFALLTALGLGYATLRSVAGDGGIIQIMAFQVAVVTNYMDGSQTVVTTPGYRTFIPYVHEVHLLDRSPVTYVMGKGLVDPTAGKAPQLIVRASDGSSFWFKDVGILYTVDTAQLATVLEDSGPAEGFKTMLVDAYARSILRDEFGRLDPEQAAQPDSRHQALEASKSRLKSALAPHGLVILEVTTSKPQFASNYEHTIERRKVAEQEGERLKREKTRASSKREQRMEIVQRLKEAEVDKAKDSQQRKLAKQGLGLERARREVDLFYAKRLVEGQTERDVQLAEASARSEEIRREAASLEALTLALESKGKIAVREALVDGLKGIEIVIKPRQQGFGTEAMHASLYGTSNN
ncbi:MAG: hypothetical protein ACI8X5_003681 [Planctomycetota bacterium]|jgi:hypothetical protein